MSLNRDDEAHTSVCIDPTSDLYRFVAKTNVTRNGDSRLIGDVAGGIHEHLIGDDDRSNRSRRQSPSESRRNHKIPLLSVQRDLTHLRGFSRTNAGTKEKDVCATTLSNHTPTIGVGADVIDGGRLGEQRCIPTESL